MWVASSFTSGFESSSSESMDSALETCKEEIVGSTTQRCSAFKNAKLYIYAPLPDKRQNLQAHLILNGQLLRSGHGLIRRFIRMLPWQLNKKNTFITVWPPMKKWNKLNKLYNVQNC